jgi:hypothetical protein
MIHEQTNIMCNKQINLCTNLTIFAINYDYWQTSHKIHQKITQFHCLKPSISLINNTVMNEMFIIFCTVILYFFIFNLVWFITLCIQFVQIIANRAEFTVPFYCTQQFLTVCSTLYVCLNPVVQHNGSPPF